MKHSIHTFSRIFFLLALMATTLSTLQAQTNASSKDKQKPTQIFDISDLKDGKHVLSSNSRSKLLILITDGKPSSIGRSINGQFHPFRPDSPCADYIAMPCADGSAPVSYYDTYEKQCVAICENFVGLLLPAVQQVREAARRTK
ncbi:MAG: hypothetical protein AB8B69_20025 [Chitinophagales bacterium]